MADVLRSFLVELRRQPFWPDDNEKSSCSARIALMETGNSFDSEDDSDGDDDEIFDATKVQQETPREDLHVRIFGMDLRGLASLRIMCGLLMLVDIWLRSGDLTAFYTDKGISPTEISKYQKAPYYWSAYFVNESWAYVAVLMMVHAVFAALLTLGYQTRLASFGSWVMLLSIQNRNEMVLDGGDFLLMNLVFWGTFFFPWGARWSLDARLANARQSSQPTVYFVGASTVAYMIFIMIVYMYNALTKRDDVWHGTGDSRATATWMALNYEQVTSKFGNWVREHFPYIILEGVTLFVWQMEMWGTLLMFVPWKNAQCRIAMVLMFVSFHLGVALLMIVGLFPYVDFASLIPLLPAEAFDWFEHRVVENVMAKLVRNRVMYRLLPSSGGIDDQAVAVHRTWVSHISEVMREPLFKTLPACFLIWFVYNWNLSNLNDPPTAFGGYVGHFWWLAPLLRIDQSWTMFAPHPFEADGWLVITGSLIIQPEGDSVDLSKFLLNKHVNYTGVDWVKPAYVHGTFHSYRWTKYLSNEYQSFVKEDSYGAMDRNRLAEYICEQHNSGAHGDRQIAQVNIYYMRENTPKGSYGPPADPEKLVFARWKCLAMSYQHLLSPPAATSPSAAGAPGTTQQPVQTQDAHAPLNDTAHTSQPVMPVSQDPAKKLIPEASSTSPTDSAQGPLPQPSSQPLPLQHRPGAVQQARPQQPGGSWQQRQQQQQQQQPYYPRPPPYPQPYPQQQAPGQGRPQQPFRGHGVPRPVVPQRPPTGQQASPASQGTTQPSSEANAALQPTPEAQSGDASAKPAAVLRPQPSGDIAAHQQDAKPEQQQGPAAPSEIIATEHTPASPSSQADLLASDGLIEVLPIEKDEGQAEQQQEATEQTDGQSSQHSISIPDDVIQVLPLQQEGSQAAEQQGSKDHQPDVQQPSQLSETPAPDHGSQRPPVGEVAASSVHEGQATGTGPLASAGDQGSVAPLENTGMDAKGSGEGPAVFERNAQ